MRLSLRSLSSLLAALAGGCTPVALDPVLTGTDPGSTSRPGSTGPDVTTGQDPTTGGPTSTGGGPLTGASTGPGTTAEATTAEATTAEATSGTSGTSTDAIETTMGGGPGSSGSSGSSSSSGSGDTTDTGAESCEPLLLLPSKTKDAGYEDCGDGKINRHTAVACEDLFEPEPCGLPEEQCDEQCDELGAGTCNEWWDSYCWCVYPCGSDADCADGAACLCNSITPSSEHYIGISQCLPANCRTDADCGGFECGLSVTSCGGPTGLFCRSALDECKSDADCTGEQTGGDLCRFDQGKNRWACEWFIRCP